MPFNTINVEEGIKLLQNSVDIKTAKFPNYIDKLKAIVLIQIKIVVKYEDLITILLSQFWGSESRNQMCKENILSYISKIEDIVREGIEKRGSFIPLSTQTASPVQPGFCKR